MLQKIVDRKHCCYFTPEQTSILHTLVNPSDEVDYAAAKTKLAAYFAPSTNETFEVYNFRSLQQLENEPIDTYITRLREAGSRCGFTDPDKEIKHQVVFSCASKTIRRKALSEDPTLDDLIKFARSLEKTNTQAKIMENHRTPPPPHVHKISKPGKYSKRYTARQPREDSGCSNQTKPEGKSCYFCGGTYPRSGGRTTCQAYGKKCNLCDRFNHFSKVCKRERKINQVERNFASSDTASSEEEYVYSVVHLANVNHVGTKINVKLENKTVTLQIDSGASVNIISENIFNSLQNTTPLNKSKVQLYAYGATEPLPVIGWFYGLIETKSNTDTAKFYVVQGSHIDSLLGLETALKLGVIKIINNVNDKFPGLTSTLQNIIGEYQSRFEGIGKLNDTTVHLTIDAAVKPVACKHRRIPFHLRDKVSEISRLVTAGVIEPINDPTGWVSPVVITNKPDGSIRLCVDMTEPNKALLKEFTISYLQLRTLSIV